MNTQTHILISTALFAKPGKEHRLRNWAAIAGGLVPDILIFVMFGWSKLIGAPEMEVWRNWYYSAPWQTAIDMSNAVPLYAMILLLGLFLAHKVSDQALLGGFFIVISLSALSHIAGDIPLHVDDGHAHFWPLSNWRYASPFSYWDPAHNGVLISILEALLGAVLLILLWRRFPSRLVHGLLAIAAIAYIVPVVYFGLFLNHH